MNLRRFLRAFNSARTTVILLAVLAGLLLLNVVLPQETVLGEERFAEVVEASPLARFFLVSLGLGRMSTSPVFLAVLGFFFLNLTSVLVSRIGPTLRRIAIRPRTEKGLRAWAALDEALAAPLPAGWNAGDVARTLRGFGYQTRRHGKRTFFGVKHRTAPVGFLLFHGSFLLLCAGGALIYYTRFVGAAVLSEGQTFRGDYVEILRRPPVGGPPELEFTAERVDPRLERGEPVHLGAVFRFRRGGSSFERPARVNDPARWGAARVLVREAGLSPVLWLQDRQGFTVDRVVAPVRSQAPEPTDVPLVEGRLTIRIRPPRPESGFPSREELAATSVSLALIGGGETLFDGALRPGEAAPVGDARLVLEGFRYWVGVQVISERGGSLLVSGFVVGLTGLVWRLVLHRREVTLAWSDAEFRLVGRSEYYSHRFKQELRTLRSTLASGLPSTPPRSPASGGGVDQGGTA